MADTWLQKTVEVPAIIDALLAKYGTEQIDSITASEEYTTAKAVLALALDRALAESGGTSRKKRRAAAPMFDQLLNGIAVIFMLGYDQGHKLGRFSGEALGYDQGQKDRSEALEDMPDGPMGRFPREYGKDAE